MMNPFVGEIRIFSFSFSPVGWLPCNGQIVSTAEYPKLFEVIGTVFGGNNSTTFGIPDLQGRVPIHKGTGMQMSTYHVGQNGGMKSVRLSKENLPSHTHILLASTDEADTDAPSQGVFAAARVNSYASPTLTPPPSYDINLAPASITPTGQNVDTDNLQPYLPINFCIAYEGISPE